MSLMFRGIVHSLSTDLRQNGIFKFVNTDQLKFVYLANNNEKGKMDALEKIHMNSKFVIIQVRHVLVFAVTRKRV